MTEFKPMIIETEYYADNTRVSNSATNWLEDSPSTFKERFIDNLPGEDIGAYKKGSMEHMWLLQKEEFWKNYEILNFETPSSAQQKIFAETYIKTKGCTAKVKATEAFKAVYSTKGKSDDKVASEGLEIALKLKSYIKYLRKASTKEIISFADVQSIKQSELNAKKHKLANKLLFDFTNSDEVYAMSEFHINWEYEFSECKNKSIRCKSLLDRFIIDVTNKTLYLVDIKTTKSVAKFKNSFEEYSYAKQLKWYWLAIEYYIKNYSNLDFDMFERKTFIIAIKNHGNKQIKVIPITEEILDNESKRIDRLMKEIRWHFDNDLWEYTREYYEGDGSEKMLAYAA